MAHRLRVPLNTGDIVLQHDTKLTKQWSHRVKDRWFGPFVIDGQHDGGSYYLKEVDGTPRAIPVAASRLRRFSPRGRVLIDGDYKLEDSVDFRVDNQARDLDEAFRTMPDAYMTMPDASPNNSGVAGNR